MARREGWRPAGWRLVLLILALIAAMATRITAGLKLDVQTTATGVAGSSGAPGMAGSTSPADETGDQYDAGDEYDVGKEEHDEDGGEHEDREAAEYDRAQALYEQAMSLRFVSTDDTDNPLGGGSVMTTNQEDLKRSIHELYAAAGVVHLSMNTSSNPNATHHTADDVEVRWRHGKIQHIEAVRELVYAFRSGTGAPINSAIAHKLVRELAAAGVAEFQCDLAATYAMGIEPVAQNRDDIMFVLREPDLDQSMLQYLFSAKSGDPVAQMALGFRHLYGIGVEKSCHAAVLYYEPVAAGVIDSSATEGGLPVDGAVRLLDRRPTDGIKPVPTVEQEMLHYQWFADHGHAEAAKAVAHLLIHGDEQDLGAALDYLTQAADMGDGAAMAHIGHAYANGIAVAQSNSTARRWFIKAAEKGHPSGLFGLGVMYLKGQGVHVDNEKAVQYFTRAISIDKDWPGRSDAFFYAGYMTLRGWGTPKDVAKGLQWLEGAARLGHLLASYDLAALLLARGNNCERAVKLLKNVAERGWGSLSEATADFEAGDYSWALYNYLRAADVGVELAQHNAAWMIGSGLGYTGEGVAELAARMYKWSAVQGNHAALVPLGDAYWYGRGTEVNLKNAADMYQTASQLKIARASFNLGYMHEHGLGLPQDLQVAQRYYEQAMHGSGYLPGALAVSWLRLHQMWLSVRGGLPLPLVSFVEGAIERALGDRVGGGPGGGLGRGVGSGVVDSATLLMCLSALVAVVIGKVLLRENGRRM